MLFLFIIPFYLTQFFGNATVINLLTYVFSTTDSSLEKYTIENEFKEYARINNLNITLNIENMIFKNPKDSYENFKSLVETSLRKSNDNISKNSNKYDLYTYSNQYTNIYAPYLLNLKKHLPNGYIEMFNSKIVKETCTYKNVLNNEDEVVGLPTYLSYDILYSNKQLLNQYNKAIPKTWDELMDTCEYIMEREKNNTELICYNGYFDESDLGLNSLNEFIYSCRDSINSTYPDLQDPSFANSLKFLKKMKERIASNDIFKSDESFTILKFSNRKFIFLKYWFVGNPFFDNSNPIYFKSRLPGMKEGIYGTSISGNNIGIIRNITDDKREASLEVLKFFTNEKRQKEIFQNKLGGTAIDKLMDEEELCEDGICDIFKDAQFTVGPQNLRDKPVNYKKRYQKYIYQFLFNENKTIDETLKHINDITKVYYVSLETKDSYLGLLFFIYSSVISILMLLSLVFLFKDNFRPFFMFLSNDFWIITILGSILLLWIPYFNYGEVQTTKCHLRLIYFTIGFTLSVCPTFHKLIALFPEEKKVIRWVVKHKYLFLIFNIIIDISLCSISLLNRYTLQYVLVEDGESFEKCKFNGIYSIIIPNIYKLLVIFLMLFLIFVEWNISTFIYEIKFISIVLYTDVLFIILIYVFHIININNYKVYFALQSISTYTISLINYIFLYGYKIFLGFIRKKDLKLQFIKNINNKFINKESQLQTKTYDSNAHSDSTDKENNNNISTPESDNKSKFLRRMVNYHYSVYYNDNSNIYSINNNTISTSTTNS